MTLPVPITPMPDEHIAGLVARAAGANVYPHAHDLLSVVLGNKRVRPEAIGLHFYRVTHRV